MTDKGENGGKPKASGSKKSIFFLILPSTSFGGSHIILM